MIFALIVAVVILIGIAFAQLKWLRNVVKRVNDRVGALFSQPDAETPSEFAQIADEVAKRIALQLKTSLMGSISAVARNEQALMRDIGKEQLNKENPLAGLVFDQLPAKWQNKIFENPAAAQAAINLFQRFGGGESAASNGHNGFDMGKELAKWSG